MWCRTAGIVAMAVTALLSGCGTVANMQPGASMTSAGPSGEEPQVYGGVKSDTVAIRSWASAVANGEPDSAARLLMWTLDLPLSAIGDTLTLPYTLSHQPEQAPNTGQPGAVPDAPKGNPPARGAADR
jgi:uncharacterized protein YceK